MSCYKPLLGVLSTDQNRKKNNPLIILPWTNETKIIYQDMIPNGVDLISGELLEYDGTWEVGYRSGIEGVNWKSKYFQPMIAPDGHTYRYVLCKCGQCIGCRLDASREWATRCELEFKAYEEIYGRENARWSTWFVTLTYDDDHLPLGSALEPTAVISDISDFMKELRVYADRDDKALYGLPDRFLNSKFSGIDPEYLPQGLRFYATSDYGKKYKRPHYHMILFGLKQSLYDRKKNTGDLEYFFTNECGDPVYHSRYLRKIWNKGFVDVGFFDWKTAAYTARYVVSKHKGVDSNYYDKHGIEAEVSRQSNRPGIGAIYYYLHENDIWKNDCICLSGGRKCPIPRYFKKLYMKQFDDLDYELLLPEQKEKFDFIWNKSILRSDNTNKTLFNELKETDLDLLGYFRAKETKKKQEANKLIRMLD